MAQAQSQRMPASEARVLKLLSQGATMTDDLPRPPLLEECGLKTAIQCYVSGMNERSSLRVEVDILHALPRLSQEAELAMFHVVEASLTNAHLHSGASDAKVTIARNREGIVVEVRDAGRGIPDGVLDRASPTKGIGITRMRERVMQLGGSLEIATGPHGTAVKARIPHRHLRT